MIAAAPGSLSAFAFLGGFTGAPGAQRGLALPNPRRTIAVLAPGWRGTFPVFSRSESDTVTFDVERLLTEGEVIAEIDRFDLTVFAYGTDIRPAVRQLGVPAISGTKVSQSFGNWQTGVPLIKYLVTAELTTSRGNQVANIVCVGYLIVRS